MSSDLMLNIENTSNCQRKAMNNDIGSISIDQDGEWDISLFDELDYLGDADELLDALESAGYAGCTDLDFDMELPPWSSDASSTCTDGDVTVDSLSPSHTLSSAASPASVEAHSPYSVHEEALSPLSSQSQPSPVSVCSESSGFSEPAPERKAPKRSVPAARAKLSHLGKRPVQLSPKVSIQPRPVITAVPLAHPAAALQASTIIIQPLQTVVPLGKSPISIQPAPPTVRPVLLPQPAQVVQLQTPQTLPAGLVAVPTPAQDRRVLVPVPSPVPTPLTTPPVVPVSLQSPGSDEDSNASRRQQRMIKNRESASISRKKKKEYLLTLEARLKVALSENEKLKNENGTLKRQLEGLISENTVLSVTAPKRRAVCLMVVVVFLVFNVGTMRLFDADAGSKLAGRPVPSGRHLLGFSPERSVGESAPETGPPTAADRFEDSVSEEKALMVVKKDPLLFGAPPPCQPPINRTKCIKLAHELRGWVHRHEVERTKTRRTSNTQQRAKTIPQKTVGKNAEVVQIATVQYTESPENDRSPGSELQVYYAPHRTYSDFFEEIGRRGDTFYVVSFRRDHLLLPATNHNKGSRPKLSVVLPAMNINESIIKDKEFEVMMQIDCEVMDTRIIHIKSSSIPPFLRANQTDSETLYHPASTNSQAIPPVGVLVGAS